MKPDEIFDFNAAEYEANVRKRETNQLREQEIVKTRQAKKAEADVGVGTFEAIATGGAAVIKPIYAGRQGEVAEAKLKIIQAELTKRGIALHVPDAADEKAVALGILRGEIVGEGVDAVLPDTIPAPTFEHVAAEMVTEETAGDGLAEITDRLPQKTCSRMNLKKHHRLRCDMCRTYFDTSYMEYLRKNLFA
ncbi:MAG: hypothetical protein Q9157_004173 [Trypethelium eluteriae]